MVEQQNYQVILLPQMEIAAHCISLAEASTWIHEYNGVMQSEKNLAVIAEESAEEPGHDKSS